MESYRLSTWVSFIKKKPFELTIKLKQPAHLSDMLEERKRTAEEFIKKKNQQLQRGLTLLGEAVWRQHLHER